MNVNQQIQFDATVRFNLIQGPRVGDFLRCADGVTRRIAYVWEDGVQPEWDGGSYHLGASGDASYSGGLLPRVPLKNIQATTETARGQFWHFDRGIARAYSGVHFTIDCRVFEVRTDASAS